MALNNNLNAFSRIAYGIDPTTVYSPNNTAQGSTLTRRPETFAGGDLQVWFNNVQVANLEAITWSTSVEIVGLYGMGSRDPRGFTKGKRVIVGSMSMQQYDRHALLEEVFQVTTNQQNQNTTLGGLFGPNTAGNTFVGSTNNGANASATVQVYGRVGQNSSTTITSVGSYSSLGLIQPASALSIVNTSAARGLSASDAGALFASQVGASIQQKASLPVDYVDMLPPFDITLVGINDDGASAYCTLYGINVTQETDGKSMNDMNPSIGISFVCTKVSPWRPILATSL